MYEFQSLLKNKIFRKAHVPMFSCESYTIAGMNKKRPVTYGRNVLNEIRVVTGLDVMDNFLAM